MHDRPGHPWTLEDLASRACMSRTVFAQKFRQKVGMTPMEYLTRWRMLLAGDRLKSSEGSVQAICSSLGTGRRAPSVEHSEEFGTAHHENIGEAQV